MQSQVTVSCAQKGNAAASGSARGTTQASRVLDCRSGSGDEMRDIAALTTIDDSRKAAGVTYLHSRARHLRQPASNFNPRPTLKRVSSIEERNPQRRAYQRERGTLHTKQDKNSHPKDRRKNLGQVWPRDWDTNVRPGVCAAGAGHQKGVSGSLTDAPTPRTMGLCESSWII